MSWWWVEQLYLNSALYLRVVYYVWPTPSDLWTKHLNALWSSLVYMWTYWRRVLVVCSCIWTLKIVCTHSQPLLIWSGNWTQCDKKFLCMEASMCVQQHHTWVTYYCSTNCGLFNPVQMILCTSLLMINAFIFMKRNTCATSTSLKLHQHWNFVSVLVSTCVLRRNICAASTWLIVRHTVCVLVLLLSRATTSDCGC